MCIVDDNSHINLTDRRLGCFVKIGEQSPHIICFVNMMTNFKVRVVGETGNSVVVYIVVIRALDLVNNIIFINYFMVVIIINVINIINATRYALLWHTIVNA